MKRTNDQSLGTLIKEFLKTNNLEEKITETRIMSLWEKIMGPGIARYTQRMTLTRGCLIVYLSSSVLRNELEMGKSKIILLINKELEKETILELIFK